MRVLEHEDRTRINLLTRSLPKRIAGPIDNILLLLIRPEFGRAAATNV
jgi:hypothetical protein